MLWIVCPLYDVACYPVKYVVVCETFHSEQHTDGRKARNLAVDEMFSHVTNYRNEGVITLIYLSTKFFDQL
jgi:hypothetical protein